MKPILKTLLLILSISLVSCKKDDVKQPPNISTLDVAEITATTAVCGGEMDDVYLGLSAGVVFSTNPNPTLDNSLTFPYTMELNEKHFICEMSYLTPNTKYYVRAYVIRFGGDIKYGEQKEFTTLAE